MLLNLSGFNSYLVCLLFPQPFCMSYFKLTTRYKINHNQMELWIRHWAPPSAGWDIIVQFECLKMASKDQPTLADTMVNAVSLVFVLLRSFQFFLV